MASDETGLIYNEYTKTWIDTEKTMKATRKELMDRMLKSKQSRFPVKIYLIQELKPSYQEYDEFIYDSHITEDGLKIETWIAID